MNLEVLQQVERAERLEALQLPLWPNDKKVMPNRFARASLFIPTARGRRKILERVILATPAGTSIEFTGKQLDMSDADVYMLCLDLAKNQELGTPIRISKYEFLKKLGRKDISGGKAYKNLDAQFERLHLAKIKIKTERFHISIHLIAIIIEDKGNNVYNIVIDKDVFQLFKNSEFSHIDLGKKIADRHRSKRPCKVFTNICSQPYQENAA